MTRPLVYVETVDGAATRDSLGAVSKAAELAGEATAVFCGAGVRRLASSAGEAGATRVFVADDPGLEAAVPQPRVDILAGLVSRHGFDLVVFPASSLATDVAAALANRLDAGLNWDLFDLELRDGELVGRRLALQDTVLVEVGWRGSPKLAVLRPGSFQPRPASRTPDVETVSPQWEDSSAQIRLLERRVEEAGAAAIEEADVVVAGGRGLAGPAGFAMLEELAALLDGTVGASLPAVEIGWYPRSALVGQSGTSVAPKLYVACGISGAIQHKLGMQNATTIVAINSDPAAPIFGFADLAVVGDLYEIVPALAELVRERKGEQTTKGEPV